MPARLARATMRRRCRPRLRSTYQIHMPVAVEGRRPGSAAGASSTWPAATAAGSGGRRSACEEAAIAHRDRQERRRQVGASGAAGTSTRPVRYGQAPDRQPACKAGHRDASQDPVHRPPRRHPRKRRRGGGHGRPLRLTPSQRPATCAAPTLSQAGRVSSSPCAPRAPVALAKLDRTARRRAGAGRYLCLSLEPAGHPARRRLCLGGERTRATGPGSSWSTPRGKVDLQVGRLRRG